MINLQMSYKEAEILQTLLYAADTRQVVRDSGTDEKELETALCSIAKKLHDNICEKLAAPF